MENFSRADLAKYLRPEDLHVLEDPRESPSRKGSLMSRVKKARQRALRNAVERDMTAEDKLKERMAANQMLARWVTTHLHIHWFPLVFIPSLPPGFLSLFS